jgi:predicted secreted protein
MRNHKLTSVVAAIPVLLFCFLTTHSALAQKSSAPIKLTDADNDRSIEAAVGQRIEIQLHANPTTGYSWFLQAFPNCLELSDFRFAPSGKQMPGAGGTQSINFIAKSSGNGDLTAEYRRPWEQSTTPAKMFKLRITIR